MGVDKSAYNQYYTLAAHYYRLDPVNRTEIVIDSLVALSQIIHFLNNNPPHDGRPYGIINIVSHGNEFTDLEMPVYPSGPRLSVEALAQAISQPHWPSPGAASVDSLTLINLHGCAIGKNTQLINLIAQAFGGSLTVQASKLFDYYAYLSPNHNPQSVKHYYARVWYAFYHPDSLTDNNYFAHQLSKRYPAQNINWLQALQCRLQSNPGDIYHYSFFVPCIFYQSYPHPDSLPPLNSRRQRLQWVSNNPQFLSLLSRTNIPHHFFKTSFYRRDIPVTPDSSIVSLKVKARAGVICIIQPLIDTATSIPFSPYVPHHGDTAFFTFSQSTPHIL